MLQGHETPSNHPTDWVFQVSTLVGESAAFCELATLVADSRHAYQLHFMDHRNGMWVINIPEVIARLAGCNLCAHYLTRGRRNTHISSVIWYLYLIREYSNTVQK